MQGGENPPLPVAVASKKFTESVILGEIARALLEASGYRAVHRRELGGTRLVWNALLRGDVDLYPEYTGTLREEILAGERIESDAALAGALEARGLLLVGPLGFNNTYAIGMREDTARRLGIRTISDLKKHPALRLRFSSEFLERADGWPALRRRYGLPHADVRGLDHDIAYRALASGEADAIDLYSTDAEIRYYGLRVLEDDLRHFPRYDAVYVVRADLEERAPGAVGVLRRLVGRFSEGTMRALNARVKIEGVSESRAAAEFLEGELGVPVAVSEPGLAERLLRRGLEHLALSALSLGAAMIVALPLGVLAARRRRFGRFVLGFAGVVQTIPSLALLVFLIPIAGIGAPPAIIALFLYSLLPILRNTASGLEAVPPEIRESALALGLPPAARLRLVELPMASPAILAGIQTSAVINVGTATLGALVGAGGYGQPIFTGIRLDDMGLILEGAVPAALLALAVQGLFELLEMLLVPRGLRMPAPDRARAPPAAGGRMDKAPS